MRPVRAARRALRFLAALVGSVVALYLLCLLAAVPLLDAVARATGIAVDPRLEHGVALLGAIVGGTAYAIRDARNRRSLERLWTFVIGTHLFTYLLIVPFFHVTDASVPGLAYYATGYGLIVVALAVAYALVYRVDAGAAVRRRAT